jgi:zinc/manganese transport system substrate-binding protein
MRIILILVAAAVLAPACSSSGSSRASNGAPRIRVVAAENVWGDIAGRIAGNDATVTSIVSNPDADPHDYEPTPRDARAMAGADLVIENGIGYDPWAQQLLAVDSGSSRTVLDVGKVLGIAEGGNPHQWYSRASVEKVIAEITADLSTIDPAHRTDYERNRTTYESNGLAEYSALIDKIKARYSGTAIGASESIVAPWARTLGLRLATPSSFVTAISEGNEPSATDKATVDAQIRDHEIAVFVFNSQNSTPDVQRLVEASRRERIPVVTVTETPAPRHATFAAWQVQQLRSLLAALDRAAGK